MEMVIEKSILRPKDDLGMLPHDANLRFNIASKLWIEIREKGLDSEAATNAIERAMFEFWTKSSPRVVVHQKPGAKRRSPLT